MPDFARQRLTMVDGQLRTYDVTHAGLLAAFGAVPREVFVNPTQRAVAYVDQPQPLGGGRALPTPMVLARLIQAAEIKPNDRVLEVGSGTGYGAAVLTALGASVVALECDLALADRARACLEAAGSAATVVTGALPAGWAALGPFDAIVMNGSFETEPTELLAQLADGGRLVGIRGIGRSARAMLYRRAGGHNSGRPVFDAAAPVLPGFEAIPAFSF